MLLVVLALVGRCGYDEGDFFMPFVRSARDLYYLHPTLEDSLCFVCLFLEGHRRSGADLSQLDCNIYQQ